MRIQSIVAVLAVASTVAAHSAYDKLLTPADVERASGAAGVKTVARGSSAGAGGDLNFATADNKLLLMVNFGDAQLYKRAREQKEMTVGGTKYPMELFAHAVTGVGDEAFASPPGKEQYVIYARKGDRAISVSTYLGPPDTGMKPRLTEAQLKQIAALVFTRW